MVGKIAEFGLKYPESFEKLARHSFPFCLGKRHPASGGGGGGGEGGH